MATRAMNSVDEGSVEERVATTLVATGELYGQGGIRTHDTREGIPVFEASAPKAEFFVESRNSGAACPFRLYEKGNQIELFVQL
jgi:hypothetical protein